MKTLFSILSSALILFSFTFQNQTVKDISIPKRIEGRTLNLQCPDPPSFAETIKSDMKKNGDKSSSDIDQSWYQKAMGNIEKEEYNISYNDELGAYQSPNRANNIRFILSFHIEH